jgi:hypothetical protein
MAYLAFNNDKERVFRRFLDRISPDIEFEIRFGSFIYNHQTKQSSFNSSVEIDFFHRLKQLFNNQSFEKITIDTIENIYTHHEGGNIKHITNTIDNSENVIIKKNIEKYDLYDYDFRLSLAKENHIEKGQLNKQITGESNLVRRKNRTSYKLGFGSLDLTIVNEQGPNNTSITKYEVELEVTQNTYDNVLRFLTVIMQTRQDNFFVISNAEKRYVLNQYRELIKTGYFVGAQPVTLQKKDMSTLYKQRYAVTDKADGDRMLLFITSKPECKVYFIDNNMQNVYKTNIVSSSYYSTLIDGELVKTNNKLCYLGFDLMAFNQTDIRGSAEYLLRSRLDKMGDVLQSVQCSKSLYVIQPKTFYFRNVFMASEAIMDTISEKPYGNDGLVFTPMDEPYPVVKAWPRLFKWKPAELNTIDFYSVQEITGNESVWKLYVQHTSPTDTTTRAQGKTSAEKVLFDVQKLCQTPVAIDKMTFQTTFPEDSIDFMTNEKFQSHTVIEYKWDTTLDKFVPLRTRWDKTLNPRKHGNFSAVACDVWNNIHNPVEKEMIFKMTTFSNAKEDLLYERMRRFHNKIKEQLYEKWARNSENLLELCSGRGGDLHKWVYNNVKSVVGYDISEKNISECRRRMYTMQDKLDNMNLAFHQLDLCSDKAQQVIRTNNPNEFQNISCHFGVHYFFQSQETFNNLIKILQTSLATNGYFAVTFMDNVQLDKLYKEHSGNPTTCVREKDGEIVYYMKRFSGDKPFGNKLRIVLNGNNILGDGSNEYIIDFPYFVECMAASGFEMVDTQLFANIAHPNSSDLTAIEREISFLNRFAVFQKKSAALEQPIKIIQNQPSPTNGDIFSTIDLHQHNLSVHKISTKYDIVDLMNCIEYKYYKNKFPNQPLITFDDICDTFQQAGITQYSPVYIESLVSVLQDQLTDATHNVRFTFHKHVVEKKDAEGNVEVIQFNHFYVVLFKGKILYNNNDVGGTEIKQNTSTQPEQKQVIQAKAILQELSNGKVTINLLKVHLKSLGLAVSGKKEDLYKRLVDHCSC